MIAYLVHIIRFFLPLTLLAGILLSLENKEETEKSSSMTIGGIVGGVGIGIVLYQFAMSGDLAVFTKTVLSAITMMSVPVMIFLIVTLFRHTSPMVRKAYRLMSAVFLWLATASTTLDLLPKMSDQGFSVTTVLNTEAILNTGSVIAGMLLMVLIMVLSLKLSETTGRRAKSFLLVMLLLPLFTGWIAEFILGILRLEVLEASRFSLSFIAKVMSLSAWLPYYAIALLIIMMFLFSRNRFVITEAQRSSLTLPQRRKQQSRIRLQSRWFKIAVITTGFTLSPLLYFHLYASRPPKISTPVELKPDLQGQIKVKIDDVSDGKLHRFSYTTHDGYVVRFFMINRYLNRVKIGVVYDACTLCGDQGYIQQGNDVICLSCNVRIFIPSIGREGGCNPIPLDHETNGDTILVQTKELEENGKGYFSEIVSIPVIDPVTGKQITNTGAPHQYEYQGRTYFFESEASWQQFTNSPDTYLAL